MTCENNINGKTLARLVAVQGLYSSEVSGEVDIDNILKKAIKIPADSDEDEIKSKPNKKQLKKIISGVQKNKDEIDILIKKFLKPGWEINRLDMLLLSIIRAAVFELKYCEDVPVRVVFDEYMNVAHAFYDTQEVGFINAILDSISVDLRK